MGRSSQYLHLIHQRKNKANQTKKCPIEACIQFFWKVVLLPSRIVQCEKIGPPDTASSRSRNQCRTTRNQTLISIKQRKKEETYTSPTSMLLVNNYFTKPAVFNIFVVKYNPVSQSTKLAFCIRHRLASGLFRSTSFESSKVK